MCGMYRQNSGGKGTDAERAGLLRSAGLTAGQTDAVLLLLACMMPPLPPAVAACRGQKAATRRLAPCQAQCLLFRLFALAVFLGRNLAVMVGVQFLEA